tara:strand:+ start:35610 stop:37250 length:1641 start_codon:yes stop_codon:yes gene_type:complete
MRQMMEEISTGTIVTDDYAEQASLNRTGNGACENVAPGRPVVELSYDYSREHGILIVAGDRERVKIAVKKGSDPAALLKIQRYLAIPIDLEIVDETAFEQLFNGYFQRLIQAGKTVQTTGDPQQPDDAFAGDPLDVFTAHFPDAADILKEKKDAFGLRLICGIIAETERQGASAVHLESHDLALVIRMRVNGVLTEKLRLPQDLSTVVVKLIHRMSRPDMADQPFPQDGTMQIFLRGKLRKVRVSTLSDVNGTGERLVLRILDQQVTSATLKLLGMSEPIQEILTDACAKPDGLILVCGPGASGKTATLYAGMKQLNDGRRNILTVENPIEYPVENIVQTQIDTESGVGFAQGLRAILHQDPDVVMIGEIDDRETAGIAVQASLDGRLVLAAINSIDAVSAITQLREMHVDPFLLASSIRVIIGQRMVRKLCEHCRLPIQAEGSLASLLGFDRGTIVFRETGCNRCSQTGFQGHTGVFEAIRVDETIRKLINNGGDEARISAHAFYNQPGLASAARAMVRQGITTPEEGIRISQGEAVAISQSGRI